MMPYGIGFSPAGSSGGHGVGSFVPWRTRTAVFGCTRNAARSPAALRIADAWRIGARLSRIQSPRPCVPATRSAQWQVLSSFT